MNNILALVNEAHESFGGKYPSLADRVFVHNENNMPTEAFNSWLKTWRPNHGRFFDQGDVQDETVAHGILFHQSRIQCHGENKDADPSRKQITIEDGSGASLKICSDQIEFENEVVQKAFGILTRKQGFFEPSDPFLAPSAPASASRTITSILSVSFLEASRHTL